MLNIIVETIQRLKDLNCPRQWYFPTRIWGLSRPFLYRQILAESVALLWDQYCLLFI